MESKAKEGHGMFHSVVFLDLVEIRKKVVNKGIKWSDLHLDLQILNLEMCGKLHDEAGGKKLQLESCRNSLGEKMIV